ncbi:MAG: hypothetical protein CMF62_13020 [Magnetococcales bacterium]|jgi:hypothetical protein|nr:hypothetical protein [Magnetococcales bacterium]|tara:strand:+ start:60444 stop:60830 length:387 start_codon:yes stop_codon:yes gene_type:complete
MKKSFKLLTGGLLMASMLTCSTAHAAYVPSTQAFETQQTTQYRADIAASLDKQQFRDALEAQGVSPDEVKERLAMLTPSQIEQLKTQLDSMPAGEGAIGAIVGAAVFVFIVLLITDLVDATDVYDFDD